MVGNPNRTPAHSPLGVIGVGFLEIGVGLSQVRISGKLWLSLAVSHLESFKVPLNPKLNTACHSPPLSAMPGSVASRHQCRCTNSKPSAQEGCGAEPAVLMSGTSHSLRTLSPRCLAWHRLVGHSARIRGWRGKATRDPNSRRLLPSLAHPFIIPAPTISR